jgi:alpha-L-fucosidase
MVRRPLPAWYDDAKLGLMFHWGPYAIPAWAPPTGALSKVVEEKGWEHWFANNPYAEWYGNSMLIPGSPTRDHHRAAWGRLGRYDAFAKALRQNAREWDPSLWMESVIASRARYVVLTAKHHDGFLMWPSRSRNPRRRAWQLSRDVVGELADAVRAAGLRFGLYYSAGLDWSFGGTPIRSLPDLLSATPRSKTYAAYVDAHWRELIARFAPSVLWSDIGSPAAQELLSLFSAYYDAVPDGVVNDRFGQTDLGEPGSLRRRVAMALVRLVAPRALRAPASSIGARAIRHADFLTAEYGAPPRETGRKWECVRGLGYSFAHSTEETDAHLLSVEALVRLLVDVVARGGNLLLGVGPSGDGSIDAAQTSRLRGLGDWLALNGLAIFSSRPWGDQETETEDGIPIRFTARDMTAYAILLGTPAGRTIVLPGLRLQPYAGLRVLGSVGYTTWFQQGKDLHVRLTEPLRESPAHVISITPQPRVRSP